MIKLQIIGNLGKDCIVKEVNGKNVTRKKGPPGWNVLTGQTGQVFHLTLQKAEPFMQRARPKQMPIPIKKGRQQQLCACVCKQFSYLEAMLRGRELTRAM